MKKILASALFTLTLSTALVSANHVADFIEENANRCPAGAAILNSVKESPRFNPRVRGDTHPNRGLRSLRSAIRPDKDIDQHFANLFSRFVVLYTTPDNDSEAIIGILRTMIEEYFPRTVENRAFIEFANRQNEKKAQRR